MLYLVFHQLKMGMEIYCHVSFILHCDTLGNVYFIWFYMEICSHVSFILHYETPGRVFYLLFSPFENKDGGLLSCPFYFALWSLTKGKFYLVFHQLKIGMKIFTLMSLLFCIMRPYERYAFFCFLLHENLLRCSLISFFLHCELKIMFLRFSLENIWY